MKKIYSLTILLMLLTSAVSAANFFSIATGNWNSAATWSSTSGGGPGITVPVAGDVVTIESGFTVTVTADAACATLNVNVGTLTIGGFNFTVSATTTISGTLTVSSTTGTKTFDNIVINTGGLFNSSVNETYSLTGSLQVDGTGSITSGTGAWAFSGTSTLSGTGSATITNADFTTDYTNTGTYTFADLDMAGGGTVTFTNNGTVSITNTLTGEEFTQGATGVLNFSGSSIGITSFVASAAGNTVNYDGVVQTVEPVTYDNLTLLGSGAKTLTGTTINGTLSIQGTATTTGTSPTYSSAILEYNGSAAQTTSNVEFPAAMGANVTINNASGVTLNAAKTMTGLLTMTSGTLNMANTNLSVGSLTGSGNLTHSSGAAGNRTLTIGTDNTSPAAYSGVISNGTATSVILTKSGTGTLILSGANSYTGKTTISAGILSINTIEDVSGGNSSLGAPTTVANGTIDIDATGTLRYTGSGHSSDRVINLLADGSTVDASGTGTLTLTGGVVTTNDNLVLTGTGVGIESGVIGAGNATLTKNGTGTWTLSGLNTYSGANTINAGTLSVNTLFNAATNSSIGTGSTTATITLGATGILQYTGSGHSTSRAIVLSADGGTIDASGSGALTLSGGVTGATFDLALTGTGSATQSGVIATTSGALIKNGTGTWTLSGLNSYTGTSTINAGILSINTLQNVSGGNSSLGAPATAGNGTIALGATGTLQYTGSGHSSNRVINLTGSDGTIDASGSGTMTLSGGVTGATFGLVLTGTGVGVESTAIGTTSGTLTKNGTGTWTLSATNTFTGGATLNAGTLNINNLQALGTVAGTFTINGGTINNTSGGNITTLNYPLEFFGDFTYSGTVPRNLNLGTGAVAMNAARIITVSAGTLTVGGIISDNSLNLTKAGAGTLSFGANAVTLNNMTISAGTLVSTSGTMELAGDFSNSGTFTHNSGTVNFNGGSSQSIGGSVSAAFNNITFENSFAGIAITVAKGATIAGVATFTDGIVSTDVTNFLSFNDGATAVGAGLDQTTDASYVSGPVLKTGNDAFTFPVGSVVTGGTGGYMPLTITAPDDATDAFRAEYVRGSATALGAVTSPLKNVSNCDYWNLNETNDAGAATSISVTLSWDDGSPCNAIPYITSPADLTVAHFTGPDWDEAGTSGSFTGSSAVGTVTRNAVTVFSPFALGNTALNENPLPVKFGNLTGYEKQSGIQIDWTAYSESNLSRYEIERSADGRTFNKVGQVAALNAITEARYGWFDAAPLAGVNFYRLRSVDMDTKFGYSSIIKVNLDKANKAITVYPNPVQGGNVSFQSSDLSRGNYTVRIFNNSGQQVYSQNFMHNGGAISKTIQLPQSIQRGMYSLQLENDGSKVMSKPFMVQ